MSSLQWGRNSFHSARFSASLACNFAVSSKTARSIEACSSATLASCRSRATIVIRSRNAWHFSCTCVIWLRRSRSSFWVFLSLGFACRAAWHASRSRCLRCNGVLHPVPKAEVLHRLEPKTRLYYHEFQLCGDCDQVYWQGTHYQQIKEFLATVRREQP